MASSTDLQLVLGLGSDTIYNITATRKPSSNLTAISGVCEPSLTLALSTNDNHYLLLKKIDVNTKSTNCEENTPLDHVSRQTSSPHSVVSSFSGGGRVKRERDLSSSEMEAEAERVSSRISDEDYEDGPNARKKLRLTKEQSALLEESFKQHSTLNPKQKQALARQLNLRPRQVEVWFQNRRARTKLKQTEVDCEFLRKCCETLTDENRRLQKELQELKALKISSEPLYMPMPAATLTMCPSCERLGGGGVRDGGGGGGSNANNNKMPFSMAPNKVTHHLFNPFTNPSAAC